MPDRPLEYLISVLHDLKVHRIEVEMQAICDCEEVASFDLRLTYREAEALRAQLTQMLAIAGVKDGSET